MILSAECDLAFVEDEFRFMDLCLNGLMLDSDRTHTDVASGDTELSICHSCFTYLPRSSMPCFALVNKLYCGQLTKEFCDLIWIKERMCAIYSNTAVITRLYQSLDPSQPTVFHGNTCAHEMNVSSTAAELPHSPPDVNGLLSVVFIRWSKFKPENLGNMYRIHKSKIWDFLQWLKTHNRLYKDILLDEWTMDLYPDDGYLPGIEQTTVHDDRSNTENMFKEETAGISEHPAELLHIPSAGSGCEQLGTMIEKTGVTNPECDQTPGRLFTSAVLRNLVSDSFELLDLVLHRGSVAVAEYNNPNLISGMYPTLFPAVLSLVVEALGCKSQT